MRAPVLFVSHGSPMIAVRDDDWTRALSAFGRSISPRAVLAVSAHWQTREPRVTASPRPGIVHDFGGFPDALYALDYPAPGDPGLARRVAAVMGAVLDADRPLDHGAWIPLRFLFPDANVPVIQLTLPRRSPEELLALGRTLAPLRDEGVLLLASGGLIHNLRLLDFAHEHAPVPEWAAAFDAWTREALLAPDREERLRRYAEQPHARAAVPTSEHWDPVYVAVGAMDPQERPRWLSESFRHGSLSMRSFQAGA